MSAFNTNSFSSDSVELRLTRLQAIEANHAMTIPLMPGLHEDIATWMQQCFTHYRQCRVDAGLGRSGKTSSGINHDAIKQDLRQELRLAKEHVKANFARDPIRRSEYGLSGSLPRRAEQMMELAERISTVHTKHEEESHPKRMSEGQITRIRTTLQTLRDALAQHTTAKAQRDGASTAEAFQFDDDTMMLERLLAAWHNDRGRADEQIGFVGMANIQPGGRRGRPGVPSLLYTATERSVQLQPDEERPQPTSYHLQYRPTQGNEEWKDYYKGNNNLLPLTAPALDANKEYEFRARARNANGFCAWSQPLRLSFDEVKA